MRKLEKCERRRSERNPFLACSFAAAQEVRSTEANAYFLQFPQVIAANEHVFFQLTAYGHSQGGLDVVSANSYVCHSLYMHASTGCVI